MPVRCFRVRHPHAPERYFAWQAAGLSWLTVPGGPSVVEVLDTGPTHIDTARVDVGAPTIRAAYDLGRQLAVLHRAGAPAWGAGPTGWDGPGFFGPGATPLDMPLGTWPDWAGFYGEARLRPIADLGHDREVLDGSIRDDLHRVADLLPKVSGQDDQWPSRVHGDLWAGNVLWSREPSGTRAVLIDPAAHGGHGESDLAMLALFGSPHLGATVRGYQEVRPLAGGWAQRIVLHQLYPVAVHAVLFHGGYVGQLRDMTDQALEMLA